MNTCYNPFSLSDKTILVTGASSGIGKAIAIECSKMGGKMIICGRNEDRLNETLSQLSGQGHQMLLGDLTIEEDLNRIIESLPKLNGVVLSAGISLMLPIAFASRKKINKVFEVNFFSQIELLRLLLKKKLLNQGSSVVAISSIAGNVRASIGNGPYGATKSALSAWIRYAAKEWGGKKIRLNSICPAMVETKLIHGSSITEEQLELDKQRYPLGRYGRPEDIAYGAIYLLSDASSWTTGISLIIDGGVTA